MRLWDYRLLKVLPDKFIISQWRECIVIKRQWEKGTLKHRLVSYVMNYDKGYFGLYVNKLLEEFNNRNIKFNRKLADEITDFILEGKDVKYISNNFHHYLEHNNRYLKQCYYNLQEKADRGIISEEEWEKIWHECNEVVKDLM